MSLIHNDRQFVGSQPEQNVGTYTPPHPTLPHNTRTHTLSALLFPVAPETFAVTSLQWVAVVKAEQPQRNNNHKETITTRKLQPQGNYNHKETTTTRKLQAEQPQGKNRRNNHKETTTTRKEQAEQPQGNHRRNNHKETTDILVPATRKLYPVSSAQPPGGLQTRCFKQFPRIPESDVDFRQVKLATYRKRWRALRRKETVRQGKKCGAV